MKKILSTTALLLLIELGIFAQNINKIEYFIDADPGYGAATNVPITAGTPVTANFSVPITSTADGFHFLTVRAKDVNNNWGIPITRPFYKETITNNGTPPNIAAMEYFVDADPGYGLGTAVSFTAGTPTSQSFTVALPNTIADGFHFLTVRAKDANNNWGIPITRPFYKETMTSGGTPPNITAMEYFIDSDPGYGLGTAVSFTAGTPVSINFPVNLGSLGLGSHIISVRAKDANNHWSIVAIKNFTVSNTFALVSNTSPAAWCVGTAFNLPFSAVGTYNAGNVFTAQLSDASGNFTSPTTLGTLTSTASGTIIATISSSVALGNGYQMRIVSSNPAITNNPNVPMSVVATCPPPCPTTLTLVSTADDYTSGVLIKEANSSTGIIVATNKITNTANVTYRAGKSITLNKGFIADKGTVFKTEFGGCN